MNPISNKTKQSLLPRFALGVLLVLALALLTFYLAMQPPMSELWLMAIFLSITALISITASYLAYRLGWMVRSPSVRWTIASGYLLSSVLAFLNVWLTARLMFASQHDLVLATILLLFAGGIGMVFGYFFASALADRVRQLDQAAHNIMAGDLNTRLQVTGRDEIAGLSRTFNQMADRLQKADEKQRQVDSLRRDLIAWVSHDLQTPLTSIRAIVEALADGIVEDPQTIQRYLHTAQRDIASLSLLIDDLFQLAQIDAGGFPLECSQYSLSDLVSDTLESFSELAALGGVQLSGQVEPGLDPVWMDAPRIGRVLNNLVANALRHTQPGQVVSLRAWREPGKVFVEVRDNGEGIPVDDLPFVFDRFYRGEKSRSRASGGSGLGLAISRGIIQAHGGQISVESTLGQGACFTFQIPRSRRVSNPEEVDPLYNTSLTTM